jgi:long-chain acyl-CoA synthetase
VPTRLNLASFVDDFRRHATETAIVSHRGVRGYRTTYGDLAQLAGDLVQMGLTRRLDWSSER